MASRYRQDMQRAWSRIAAIPTGKLETRLGTVEYAEQSAGRPVLVCHGVFGCHADGLDGWWTRMLGEGSHAGTLDLRRSGGAENGTNSEQWPMRRRLTVLVTGGTGGIGYQTARALAQRGARLLITGRDGEAAGRPPTATRPPWP